MTDPGLNTRLRQRSRRAGLMIGLSMALTIAVCVGGFSVIYAALDGFTGDFVSRDAATTTPTAAPTTETAASDGGDTAQTQTNGDDPAPTAEPTSAPTEEPTATPDEFTPDYQVTSASTVYFRSGPGTSFDPVTSLPPETPLQSTGDREQTSDADADGFSGEWVEFRTEDGQEGWIREIDVDEYQP